jgi:hypothetical protein
MDLQPVDERLDFIGSFVQKTMKLKPEKWTKMIGQVSLSKYSKT